MALRVGQLERLSNSELQKEFAKDRARGRADKWNNPSHRKHLERLRNQHEQARGKHGNTRRDW